MKNKPSNFNLKPHKKDGYGDLSLWYRAMNSGVWKKLFLQTPEGLFQLLMAWRKFLCQAMIFSVAVFFRYRYSRQNIGLFLLLYSLCIQMVFNSTQVWLIFKPIVIIVTPFTPVFLSWEQLRELVMIDIHSTSLFYFSCASFLLGLAQVVMAWAGNIKAEYRGENFLLRLLTEKVTPKIEAFHLAIFLEIPLLAAAAMYFLAHNDAFFGTYLAIAAFLMTTQELTARAEYQRLQSILRA